jgi:hypothetical protein
MSILINMEMPTNCYDCDFAYQDQDSEHNVYWTCAAVHKAACMYERREDCPLIPVPEHGRLVDADSETFPTPHRNPSNDYMKGWNACLRSVQQQPTIIPASEEGE